MSFAPGEAYQFDSHELLGVKSFYRHIAKSPARLFRYPWSEPNCMTRPVSSAGSNSHTVAAVNGCTNIPRACGDGSGERDHSGARHLKPNRTSVRPPGSARIDLSWEITKSGLCALLGGLHHSTLDNDAQGDIFPERDQQLSRQRNDCRLSQAATLLDAFLEPQGERRLWLMTQP
jgi:hypothetical protein